MQNAVAFANNDVITIAWSYGKRPDGCMGFAVYRIDDKNEEKPLPSHAVFKGYKIKPRQTTAEFPIQKFYWKDPYARLVATNTQDPSLESQLDYITRHVPQAQRAEAKPILVNEYAPLPPSEVLRQVRRARRFGTHFMYWRGDHSQSQWESTLAELETIAASGRAKATIRSPTERREG